MTYMWPLASASHRLVGDSHTSAQMMITQYSMMQCDIIQEPYSKCIGWDIHENDTGVGVRRS